MDAEGRIEERSPLRGAAGLAESFGEGTSEEKNTTPKKGEVPFRQAIHSCLESLQHWLLEQHEQEVSALLDQIRQLKGVPAHRNNRRLNGSSEKLAPHTPATNTSRTREDKEVQLPPLPPPGDMSRQPTHTTEGEWLKPPVPSEALHSPMELQSSLASVVSVGQVRQVSPGTPMGPLPLQVGIMSDNYRSAASARSDFVSSEDATGNTVKYRSDEYTSSFQHHFNARRVWYHGSNSNIKITETLHPPRRTQGHERGNRMLKRGLSNVVLAPETRIVQPGSCVWFVWTLICMLAMIYDMFCVPLRLSFALEGTEVGLWIADSVVLTIWLVNIFATFRTAYFNQSELMRDPTLIARNYMRKWLLFDMVMCLVDVIILIFVCPWWETSVSALHEICDKFRVVKLLRMLRLSKAAAIMIETWQVRMSAIPYPQNATLLCAILFGAHVMGCMWHMVGSTDGGWSEHYHEHGSADMEQYLASVHWSLSQIHGTTALHPNNASEYAFAIFDLLWSFVAFALFVGYTGHFIALQANAQAEKLKRTGARYIQSHGISPVLSRRMKKFIESRRHQQGLGEQLQEERNLLLMLPPFLQADLYHEARGHIITRALMFFHELHMLVPSVLRQLCHKALTDIMVLNDEVVFETGDACSRVLFVDNGSLHYMLANDDPARQSLGTLKISRTTSRMQAARRPSTPDGLGFTGSQMVSRGCCLPEAVLWTLWTHCGTLTAAEDSSILAMEAEAFASVIVQYPDAQQHAYKYCKFFLSRLNKVCRDACVVCSDIMHLYRGMEVDDLNRQEQGSEEHLVFLSHYKVEAGTEAALMCEGLDRMLDTTQPQMATSFTTPVFLDSENLSDLRQLQRQVELSHNLILLLTPGVLSRPWCLVEVVTARRNHVRIVPVKVERQGADFQYPSESYFQRLSRGEELNTEAWRLLASLSISRDELVRALRHTFSQIALPFSPHKSAAIREAELSDILKRCSR